jgi:hypothetical protein
LRLVVGVLSTQTQPPQYASLGHVPVRRPPMKVRAVFTVSWYALDKRSDAPAAVVSTV